MGRGRPLSLRSHSCRSISMKLVLSVFTSIVLLVCGAAAQTPAPARVTVGGTIVAVNASANQVSLKSDKGETIALAITPRSNILRLPAGETETKNAVKIAIGDLAAGDL